MKTLPKTRTADILEQEANKELMLYDLRIDKAYVLNETLSVVYKACSGQTLSLIFAGSHSFAEPSNITYFYSKAFDIVT